MPTIPQRIEALEGFLGFKLRKNARWIFLWKQRKRKEIKSDLMSDKWEWMPALLTGGSRGAKSAPKAPQKATQNPPPFSYVIAAHLRPTYQGPISHNAFDLGDNGGRRRQDSLALAW